MNVPEYLIEEAIRLSGATSRTMAVVMGLQELILKKRLQELAELRGTNALALSLTEQKRLRKR